MNQAKQYPAKVQQIHREFFTASDRLLAEAKNHLSSLTVDPDKVGRLKRIGFKNANEVAAFDHHQKVAGYEISMRELIETYSVKYPNNKFIDKNTVEKICSKYKLVCAPVERYKGFVPKDILPKIEGFSMIANDAPTDVIRVTKWSYDSQSKSQRMIAEKFPDGIPVSFCSLNDSACVYMDQAGFNVGYSDRYCFIKSYSRPKLQ